MSSVAVPVVRYRPPAVICTLNIAAKALLVTMLVIAVVAPEAGHMEDKAAGLRAVAYPLLAFTVPVVWWLNWRERSSFPWLADLLVTITCFTDTLGNRLDLYDTVVFFDDWMHFMNTGLVTGAVILLTLHHTSTPAAVLERALAFGVSAAVTWELAEYFAFVSHSSERLSAYTDTLGDLALGTLGALLAAGTIAVAWRSGRLRDVAPQLELRRSGTPHEPEVHSSR